MVGEDFGRSNRGAETAVALPQLSEGKKSVQRSTLKDIQECLKNWIYSERWYLAPACSEIVDLFIMSRQRSHDPSQSIASIFIVEHVKIVSNCDGSNWKRLKILKTMIIIPLLEN